MISSFSLFSFQGALSHGQFHRSQAFRKFRPAKPLRLPPSVCRGFHLLFSCELPRDVYASIMLALVGLSGLEPPTSRLSGVRSNQLSYKPILKSYDSSGDEEIRTLDPLLARQVLSQLSYIPI